MKKSVYSFFAGIACAAGLLLLTSCENEIRIRANQNGVDISYSVDAGAGFKDLISLMGDGETEITGFDPDTIKTMFEEAGFQRVNVDCPAPSGFKTKAVLPEDASDPVSKSGMLAFSVQGKFINVKMTRETLTAFYDNCPQQIQSYVDMFMAPAFTGEEISDEEYVETLASVYGQKLADELAASKIQIVLESPTGNVTRHTISLITLLNLTGEIKFSA